MGSNQIIDRKSSGSRSPWRSILGSLSFEEGARIVCLAVLVVFAWYLFEGLNETIQDILLRLASDRPLNLPVKLSLLFQTSHLLSIPFMIYLIVRDLIHDRSEEA